MNIDTVLREKVTADFHEILSANQSVFQFAIIFSNFEYMKIAIHSPLQLLNLSRATKEETQQFWFHTKQLIPFQTIFYWFYFMFGTLQDFLFCNLTSSFDSELTGYICFFTAITMSVFSLAWIKCSQTVRWAFLMWLKSLPGQDVPSPGEKKISALIFSYFSPFEITQT